MRIVELVIDEKVASVQIVNKPDQNLTTDDIKINEKLLMIYKAFLNAN
jgi:hypothetical protein